MPSMSPSRQVIDGCVSQSPCDVSIAASVNPPVSDASSTTSSAGTVPPFETVSVADAGWPRTTVDEDGTTSTARSAGTGTAVGTGVVDGPVVAVVVASVGAAVTCGASGPSSGPPQATASRMMSTIGQCLTTGSVGVS